jgi:hypothetical protein
MEASSDKGVTPEGVRAGDRAALQGLVDRRGPAVIAFCTQVCGPQAAERAAAEAFARFRAAVRATPDLSAIDPETLLRGATRHAAASLARQPSGPPPHGKLRSRGTQTCQHVPTMLAARANGALGEADLDRLARHLERCERCDALGEIFRRAELAYQDPPVDTLGTDTSSVLMDALAAVPEHGHGIAPAPAGDVPAGEALDGAFGHLPELDDEVPLVQEVPPLPAEPAAEAEAEADAGVPGEVIPLEVEHVAEPATELHAVDLAAEPLPDEAPAEALDEGATMEWDNELPPVAAVHEPDAAPADAPLLTGGKARRSGPRPLTILLPVLLVLALAAGAAALAGVFGSDDGAPAVDKAPAPHVQAPVTTPLPIKVKPKASSSTPAATTGAAAAGTGTTAASDGTAAATGTDGTAGTGATDATGTTP